MTNSQGNNKSSEHTSQKAAILGYLMAGKIETALSNMTEFQVDLKASDFDQVIKRLNEDMEIVLSKEQTRSAKRLNRIIDALQSLHRHGPDPGKIIPPVILPQGYNGKILLMSVSGGIIGDIVILRSGDLWHSEILRETKEEIQDLGLLHSDVYPLGGAWARFENDDTILIWGSSDQFGACDKEFAAEMIRKEGPEKEIKIK